jgi:hypothetical protein
MRTQEAPDYSIKAMVVLHNDTSTALKEILLLNGCGIEAESPVKLVPWLCAGLAADSPN